MGWNFNAWCAGYRLLLDSGNKSRNDSVVAPTQCPKPILSFRDLFLESGAAVAPSRERV